eukprot:1716541-Lingulodinium_polyedra.AAC.1
MLAETNWSHWPITGPRTVLWCCNFILEVDGTPRARHTRWLHECQLSQGDAGVADHEVGMRCLEFALCYDQVAVSELACMELMLRKVQVAELKHRERILGVQGGDGLEDYLYLGEGQTRGYVMVAPMLE